MTTLITTNHRVTLPLSACVLVLAVGCSGQKEQTKVELSHVLVEKAGHSDSNQQASTLSGTIESKQQTPVSFRAGGMVVAKYVNVGDRVRKGQVLAQVDNADYQLAKAAAIQQAQAIQASLAQVTADENRLKSLVGDNTVSQSEYEQLQSKGIALRAQLKQVQQQVGLQGNQLKYTALVAPHNGVVSALYIDQGQNVAPGMPALLLSAEEGLEVAVDIAQSAANSPAIKSASAQINGQMVALRLRHISPIVTPRTQSVAARYSMVGAPANLTLGTTVAVTLQGVNASMPAGNANTVVLPASSVVKLQQQAFVWVVPNASNSKGSKLVKRPVSVSQYSAEQVQVQGVQSGEYVVSVGAFKLTPGTQVLAYDRATLAPIATLALQ